MSGLLSAEVLELFAEAQGFSVRPEWLESAGTVARRGAGKHAFSDLWSEDRAAYFRAWRKAHPEKARALTASYRARQLATNREAYLARQRERNRRYYARHAEAMRARAKTYAVKKKAEGRS